MQSGGLPIKIEILWNHGVKDFWVMHDLGSSHPQKSREDRNIYFTMMQTRLRVALKQRGIVQTVLRLQPKAKCAKIIGGSLAIGWGYGLWSKTLFGKN